MLKEDRFSTRMRPLRSKTGPREAGSRTSRLWLFSACSGSSRPSRPGDTRTRPAAMPPGEPPPIAGCPLGAGRRADPRRSSPASPAAFEHPESQQPQGRVGRGAEQVTQKGKGFKVRLNTLAREPNTKASRSVDAASTSARGPASPNWKRAPATPTRKATSTLLRPERPRMRPPKRASCTHPAAAPASMPWVSPPPGRRTRRPPGRGRRSARRTATASPGQTGAGRRLEWRGQSRRPSPQRLLEDLFVGRLAHHHHQL